MNFSNKKERELAEASFFLNRFNARHGTDYQPVANSKEDTQEEWIDVFAVSRSDQYPRLDLQLTTRDAILRKEEGRLSAEARRTKKGFAGGRVISIDSVEWVQEAIQNKKYPPEMMQSLVLLVTTDVGPLLNEEYAKRSFAKLQLGEYKGVYYVHLPNLPENSSPSHRGQIVSIKGICGDNGLSF